MALPLALFLLAISSTSPAAAIYSTEGNNMMNKLSKYCPYTDYCHSNGSAGSLNESEAACCVPCSCQEDCWKKGNCCPDFKGTTKPQIEICQDTIVKRAANDIKVYRGLTGQIKLYNAIGECPLRERSMRLNAKCLGYSGTSYEDFVWVSDTLTNKIYNNRFCAECNNVHSYVEWSINATCTDIFKGDYTYSRARIVPKKCSLIVVPPANMDVSANECFLPDITKCNVSGLWKMYDKDLEHACHAFEQKYVHVLINGQTHVYRNVFCYLCNRHITGDPEQSIVVNCPKLDDLSTRNNGVTFTALLDRTFYKKPEGGDESPCAINEILDPVQEKCRELSCPVLNAPWYGFCRRLALKTHFLGLRVYYRLHYVGDLSGDILIKEVSMYNHQKLGQAILMAFLRKTGLLDSKCDSCDHAVRMSDEVHYNETTNTTIPEYYVIESQFMTNEYCDEEFLTNRLLLPLVTEMAVELISGRKIRFALSFEQRSVVETGRLTQMTAFWSSTCVAAAIINLSKTRLCPTITLTRDEYFAMMNATTLTVRKEKINSLFGVKSAGSAISSDVNSQTSVCFEDYKLAHTSTNKAHMAQFYSNVLTITLSVAYFSNDRVYPLS